MRGSVKNTQIIPILAHIIRQKVSKKSLPGSMNIYVVISNIHIILSNTKAGRGAWNHNFLLNIGVGACALSALAHNNLFICIDLWSYIYRMS
jgi:hypothetical protein